MEPKIYEGPGGHIIQMSTNHFCLLIHQMAACVLHACRDYPTDGTRPVRGAEGILAQRMYGWSEHSTITNALLMQVKLLYHTLEAIVQSGKAEYHMFVNEPSRQMVVDALAEFQKLKEAICRHEQSVWGEHWGMATGFFRADFSDQNEKFLALYENDPT